MKKKSEKPSQSENATSDTLANKVFLNLPEHRLRIIKEIENENLKAVEELTNEWNVLVETAPDYLFPDLCLMHPLCIAVNLEKYSVVVFLIEKCNQRLHAFHGDCSCRRCQHLMKNETFLNRYSEFMLYAASSLCYFFSHDSTEVIDKSLTFARHLKKIAHLLKKEDVKVIRDRIEKVIIRAFDCCVSQQQTFYLLKDLKRSTLHEEQRVGKMFDFIELEMKEVVQNSTLQTAMNSAIYSEDNTIKRSFRKLEQHNPVVRLLFYIFSYFILVPLVIFFPYEHLIELLRMPILRLHIDSLSFWFFLVFGIAVSASPYSNLHLLCEDNGKFHSPEFNRAMTLDLLFATMVLSQVIKMSTCLYWTGKNMFMTIYDIFNFLSIHCYAIGITLILISIFVIPGRSDVQRYCRHIFVEVENATLLGSNCEYTKLLYRNHPNLFQSITAIKEPYVVGAAFQACGHLLYCISVGHRTLVLMKSFAVYTIAAQKMSVDVLKWLFMVSLFFLGFALAFTVVYSTFICSNIHFSSISASARQLFWVMFTMTKTQDFKLDSENAEDVTASIIVERFGEFLYCSIFVVGALVMVNLIIALISIRYNDVYTNRQSEVILALTRQKVKYILWRDYLPMPFNLFYPVHFLMIRVWKEIWKRWMMHVEYKSRFEEYSFYNSRRELTEKEIEHLEKRIEGIFQELKLNAEIKCKS